MSAYRLHLSVKNSILSCSRIYADKPSPRTFPDFQSFECFNQLSQEQEHVKATVGHCLPGTTRALVLPTFQFCYKLNVCMWNLKSSKIKNMKEELRAMSPVQFRSCANCWVSQLWVLWWLYIKYGHRNIPSVQAGACSQKYVAVKRPGLLPAFEVCDLLIRVATHRRGTGLSSCRCFCRIPLGLQPESHF